MKAFKDRSSYLKNIIQSFLFICLLFLAGCPQQHEPFSRLKFLYDEAVNVYNKVKNEKKDSYNELLAFWKSQRPEIEKIQEDLKKEITLDSGKADKEKIVLQLIDLINKIYELKKVISEKEID